MTPSTLTRRTIRAAAFAAAPLLLAAPPARAGNPVSAFGIVYVQSWTGPTAKVCAFGYVDDGAYLTGEWAFAIVGVRSDSSVIGPPMVTHSGDSMPTVCQNISTDNTDYGVFTANLTFAGANITDVTGVAGMASHWEPGNPHTETFYSTSLP